MQIALHHACLPNGLRIEYAEHGRRGGPALLLHGITDSRRASSWCST